MTLSASFIVIEAFEKFILKIHMWPLTYGRYILCTYAIDWDLSHLIQLGRTAVREACVGGHFKVLKLLQQHGASVVKEDLVRHRTMCTIYSDKNIYCLLPLTRAH